MRVSDLVPWRNNAAPRRGQVEDERFDLVRRELNQLFSEFFEGLEAPVGENALFNPRVNVTESDDEYEATVELPGLAEEDIELTLTRDGLLIQGEKRDEAETSGKNYYRRERRYGSFRRLVPLPTDAIERDAVDANFERGVLTVRLPKREETQPASRNIPVQSG